MRSRDVCETGHRGPLVGRALRPEHGTERQSVSALSYISTRGEAPHLTFPEALTAGLAADGGLYLPAHWPRPAAEELRRWAGLDYAGLAAQVLGLFAGDALPRDRLGALTADAYGRFDHPAVAPLTQIGPGLWLMELFHGPTLAFKDYALQLVGRLFDAVLVAGRRRVTIVGATSGDTGAAGMEACRDRDNIDVFILYPHGRVSDVQRRMMTTMDAANVHPLAVDGTFDDCQDMVKAMFADAAWRDRLALSAVNSINIARIVGQIVYYAWAAASLGGPGRPLRFAVPTGNFGNVYAGYGARAMGLDIDRLMVATNANDILHRFLATGRMAIAGVTETLSPAMDIQVSSNFERLLFDLLDRSGPAVADAMARFRAQGELPFEAGRLARARALFASHRADDATILDTIAAVAAETGMLIDPHTACAVAGVRADWAADPAAAEVPRVVLACAHPAKFPDAVERATGRRPALPDRLADLPERRERVVRLPNDLARVQRHIEAHARAVSQTV